MGSEDGTQENYLNDNFHIVYINSLKDNTQSWQILYYLVICNKKNIEDSELWCEYLSFL